MKTGLDNRRFSLKFFLMVTGAAPVLMAVVWTPMIRDLQHDGKISHNYLVPILVAGAVGMGLGIYFGLSHFRRLAGVAWAVPCGLLVGGLAGRLVVLTSSGMGFLLVLMPLLCGLLLVLSLVSAQRWYRQRFLALDRGEDPLAGTSVVGIHPVRTPHRTAPEGRAGNDRANGLDAAPLAYLPDPYDRQRTILVTGAWLLGFLVVDVGLGTIDVWFLPLPVYWTLETILAGTTVGFVSAQILLAAGFAALGDGSSPRRVLWTTFLVAIFCNLVVTGLMGLKGSGWRSEAVSFVMTMLAYSLGQIPMWGFRLYRGWVVRFPWSEPAPAGRFRFTVGHLLGLFMFLVVPLCILQGLQDTMKANVVWFAIAWGAISCGLFLAAVRVILGVFPSPQRRIAAAALALVVAGIAQVGWLLAMFDTDRMLMSSILDSAWVAWWAASLTALLVVGLVLASARRLGFRLQTRR